MEEERVISADRGKHLAEQLGKKSPDSREFYNHCGEGLPILLLHTCLDRTSGKGLYIYNVMCLVLLIAKENKLKKIWLSK